MLDQVVYYAKTFVETVPALFGVRGVFEQPAYAVRAELGAELEIRDYGQTMAAEATVTAATREEASETAFRLLFAYITGANTGSQMIAMTTPVQQAPVLIERPAPVRVDVTDGGGQLRLAMRFSLPAKTAANPPVPSDSRVKLVSVPATTVAALRYSGNPNETARIAHQKLLLDRLAASEWKPSGEPYTLNYDPPFAVPFLKRNEIVVPVVHR